MTTDRATARAFVEQLFRLHHAELYAYLAHMVREPEAPAYAREELVLDLAKLRANAKEKTASWGRGTALQDAQEPPKTEKKAPAAVPAKEATP